MKIVIPAPLEGRHREAISVAAQGAEVIDRMCRSTDEIAALITRDTDVLMTFRMPNDILERAPGLKWVQLLSAGADWALGGPLKGVKIPVTNASGIHATPIAEYTLASMLAWAHKLHISLRAQLKHEWHRGGYMGEVDVLRDKTLGVVGYGSIGRETARLARAFGMRVVALKRNPEERRDTGWCPAGLGDPGGTIPEKWYGPDSRKALLAESDFVTNTLPFTPHTKNFIGVEEIAAMNPGSYIVNIGRGGTIDERALADAIKAGGIGGAGLDVFEHEPLEKESPLWDLENVLLTPHISGGHKGYMDMACELFAENLRRFTSGRPLLNVVDPALGY